MAESDSTPRRVAHPALAFRLRGEAVEVVHTSGSNAITRTAVIEITKVTFLNKGEARQTSSVICTFLENFGVKPTDTITLPGEQPRAILKATCRLGDPGLRFDGYLTEVLLA